MSAQSQVQVLKGQIADLEAMINMLITDTGSVSRGTLEKLFTEQTKLTELLEAKSKKKENLILEQKKVIEAIRVKEDALAVGFSELQELRKKFDELQVAVEKADQPIVQPVQPVQPVVSMCQICGKAGGCNHKF
jgi:predicted nuclease with TOPRIM domain